jgi:5-methylcytosine-specific restriction endonuclease McrA
MLLPLSHYDKSAELELPRCTSTGNCRLGYGVPVIEHWGTSCAYCGKDLLASYDAWLDLSVDHVVPACVLKQWGPDYGPWIGSIANVVPCCRACNEFLNGYRTTEEAPSDGPAFLQLRKRVLAEKRELALKRHQQELTAYAVMASRLIGG